MGEGETGNGEQGGPLAHALPRTDFGERSLSALLTLLLYYFIYIPTPLNRTFLRLSSDCIKLENAHPVFLLYPTFLTLPRFDLSY